MDSLTHEQRQLIEAVPDLVQACKSALFHIHEDVCVEADEGREGSASKLHDELLAALIKAGAKL